MFSRSENFRKKTGVLFLVIFLTSIFFPFSSVKADVPVFDLKLTTLLGTTQTKIIGNTGLLVTKEYGFDNIAWLVAKSLLKTLSTQIINWIKTGDSRGPSFIENFLEHFMKEMDNAVGLWLEQYFGKNSALLKLLCEPFRLGLPPLLKSYAKPLSYSQRAKCKLSDIVRNVENFSINIYFDDFSHGGWDAWFAMLEPEHNFIGQYLLGTSEIEAEKAKALLNSQTEVNTTGGGLLSWQQCDDVPITDGDGELTGDTYKGACRIQTPGGIVQDQLVNVFGSGMRQLEIADELNEILAAFFQVMVGQLLSSVGGFSGSDFNATSNNNPINIPPPPSAATGLTIDAPLDGSYAKGTIKLSAFTSNISTTTSVQFTLGGSNLGSLIPANGSGNFETSLDTSTLSEGAYSLTAILFDQSGNKLEESPIVTFNIDRTPPTVGLPSTTDGTNLVGNVNRITVEAADSGDESAVTVVFLMKLSGMAGTGNSIGNATLINGRHRLSDWDSRNLPDGVYELSARATDRAGNITIGPAITVTINN